MPARVKIGEKKCASCIYWEGERKIWSWGQKPHSVDAEHMGYCPARKGGIPANLSCRCWREWENFEPNPGGSFLRSPGK